MELKQNGRSKAEIIAQACGILAIILGLTIISAWILKLDTVLQLDPHYTPMVFNTALSFVLCGIGTMCFGFRINYVPQTCGALASTLALATLFQYFFELDLGLDKLVVEPYITVGNPYPGRMAPNTSLGFLFTGLAVALLNQWSHKRVLQMLISLIGSSAVALGVTVLFGYAVKFETIYGWGTFTRMAPTTAIGFVLCGISLFCFSITQESRTIKYFPRWLPVPAGIAIATASLIIWNALSSKEIQHFRNAVKAEARESNRILNAALTDLTDGLTRMSKRIEKRSGLQTNDWKTDAGIYRYNREGIKALFLLDSDFGIISTFPSNIQKSTANQNLPEVTDLRQKFENTDEPALAEFTPFPENRIELTNFLLTVPIYSGKRVSGYLQGEYDFQELATKTIRNTDLVDLEVSLPNVAGKTLLSRTDHSSRFIHDSVSIISDYYGQNIRLTVWPKLPLYEQSISQMPETSLFAGLITAILVAVVIAFHQKARQNTFELSELNQSLELQVEGRTKELTKRDEFTRGWLSNCTDGAWDWDLEKNTVFMTPQFKELLGYNEEEISDSVDIWRKLVPPMDLQVADKAYQDYINNGQRYAYQLRWIHKNGSMVWTLCRGEGIKDGSGKIVRMVGTLTDISKHKKLEEELIHWAEQLERKNSDLERFNRLAVGREKRMIELKNKINELCRELGKPELYNLTFAGNQKTGSKSLIG